MMRKLGSYIILLVILTSCVDKEKYYGNWLAYSYDNPSGYAPYKIKIDKDSIHLSATKSDIYNSFPLQFKSNGLSFMEYDFKVSVKSDTLLHFQDYIYIKTKVFPEEIVKTSLPNIQGFEFLKKNPSHTTSMWYGKNKETNEYQLQLNDKYISFKDIPSYILDGPRHREYTPHLMLYYDKNAPIKDLETIFFHLQLFHLLKVSLVNKIDYSIGSEPYPGYDLQYMHSLLTIKILPLVSPNYFQKLLKRNMPPFPEFELPINKKHHYYFLINNEFYSGKEKVSRKDLINQCENLILNKELGVFLYDKESSYSKFIEFTMCYQGTLNKLRNDEAFKLHEEASFEYLTIENKIKLTEKFPNISINGYSIEHFKSFENHPNNHFEFPFYDLDSKIPDFYLEKLKE